ncbi:recombinase family protein [bacterium]|nr:recombinase family protein [bacterium]
MEADRVRQIFNLYLEHRSLREVVLELDRRQWTAKSWITKKGNLHQGLAFNKQRLSSFLKNALYIGKIRYKDELYEGEHEAIVDMKVWRAVQDQLRLGNRTPDHPRNRYRAILRGLLFCQSCNSPMIHLPISKNKQRVYRYYVCENAHTYGWDQCPSPSIPADQIEQFVIDRIRDLGSDDNLLDEIIIQVEKLWRERVDGMNREIERLERFIGSIEGDDQNVYQSDLRAAKVKLHDYKTRIEESKRHGISVDECLDGMMRFDDLWGHLTTDEQIWVLNLIFTRIDFNGANSKICVQLRKTGITSLAS